MSTQPTCAERQDTHEEASPHCSSAKQKSSDLSVWDFPLWLQLHSLISHKKQCQTLFVTFLWFIAFREKEKISTLKLGFHPQQAIQSQFVALSCIGCTDCDGLPVKRVFLFAQSSLSSREQEELSGCEAVMYGLSDYPQIICDQITDAEESDHRNTMIWSGCEETR